VPSIAQALSFSFYQGSEPQQQLWDYLCKKSVFFVLDNFDHLVDGAGQVTDLLEAAPRVKILVTSRARLCVQNEFLFPLNGLDVPEQVSASIEASTASAAVRLFLHGARRVQPAFGLTMENLAHVVQICRLVQGMPLGILLAAAWVQMLSPAEIAAEVGQSVDLLETDLRDVPERQRSIRAVFDHSWNLLTDGERGVLQGLSVFRGGFTQKAARQVTGASLRHLRRLVDKSLLHRTSSGRYEIHSLLVQCAGERLAQSSDAGKAVQDRHISYYAAKLQRWGKDLKGSHQQVAEAEMESEIDNVRIAWERMVDQRHIEQLDQAIEGLCLFYLARVRSREGESACRAVANGLDAAASPAECEVLAKALAWMGVFGWLRGQTGPPIRLLEESLRLLERPELAHRDTRPARALVLCQLGVVLQYSDRDRANRLYEQSVALYRSIGDRWGEATALQYLGWLTSDLGRFRMAQALLRASLRLRRRLGDRRGIASVLRLLGVTAICRGRLGQGRRLIRESAAIYREMGDRAGICDGLREQGFALLLSGKLVEARTLLRKSMALADDLGHRWQLAEANLISGFALVLSGEYREAHDAGQRGLLLSREIGYQRGIALALFLLGCLAVAATEFADAQRLLQESVDIYQVLGQRHELGQAYAALTYAERGLGRREEARRCLALALRTSIDIEAPVPLLIALPAAALLAADQGEIERALALYALVLRLPVMANSRLFEDVAGKHIRAASAALPPEAVAAAKERVRVRHLGMTAEALLAELDTDL
jgi:predicted ATPase